MARTLTEIFTEAKEARKKYLELTEFENSSKMSIMDAITWVTASCIWTFENLLDVFKVDIAQDINNRINGTPAYYANALLKYQDKDTLEINEEGTAFSYPTIDEKKRIITCASYQEYAEEGFHDKGLILKVAKGSPGNYEQLDDDELIRVKAYIEQIKFAGTLIKVVSRKGDILIPRVTVYYDGAITADEVYQNIANSLNEFIASVNFDSVIYAQKVVDAIQKAEHVVDVYYDNSQTDLQGIFLVQYDDDGNIINQNGRQEIRIDRLIIPNSGYIKESSKQGLEETFPTWRESIVLQVENG